MSEAIDTAAPDHPGAAFIPKLLKLPEIEQQGPRMVVQKDQQLITRLSPHSELDF